MDFKGLEQLISDIANQKGITTNVITEDLEDFLRSKYSVSIRILAR